MKEDLKYKGVDFSDIESDREFYGCTFEECSFARVKLTNVLFSRCEFIRCDFSLCKIYIIRKSKFPKNPKRSV